MSERRLRSVVVGMLVAALGALAPTPGHATQKFGPLQIAGNLQTTALVRTPDQSTYEFVSNRNVARIRLDYDWLQAGKFYNKYDIPFIESSHLFLLWRGVYDSVYSTTPGFVQKTDIHGRAYGGKNVYDYATQTGNFATGRVYPGNALELSGLTNQERDAFKFENVLREAYADIKFRGIPLSIRAGRQQIVWGETDNFRMLDRVNSLDLTWHFQQEIPVPAFGWDEIRRPFWMIKFLYDLGDVWRLSQNFLEWYWNPGDWHPAKQAFLPRPWGLPFFNPLTNPFDGVFIGGACGGSRETELIGGKPIPVCRRLMKPSKDLGLPANSLNANGAGTRLFEQGDYNLNPLDNSQVGVRYHAIAPFGLEFTLNYFYQRWGGDDGTNYAPLRGLTKNAANDTKTLQLEQRGIFPAEFFAPYVHTIGTSGNYSDETFPQTVFRYETIYDVGLPFFDVARETTIDRPALPGVRKKNMWKGMIAFDRPTWIKTLNKKSTIFLTGQFFWHYLVNNPGCKPELVANLPTAGKERVGSCLTGPFDLPSIPRLGNSPLEPSFRDKVRTWESLFSLAAFTFYRGGSIVPVAGLAVDWVNQWTMEPFWSLDYVVRDDFVVNVAQRYFVTPQGHSTPIFETWGLGGLNHGRSETELRLTYQF